LAGFTHNFLVAAACAAECDRQRVVLDRVAAVVADYYELTVF
jgi:hypothetical protein